MQIDILAFGIAKDIINGSRLQLEVAEGISVGQLKEMLCRKFPDFSRLASLRLAVNSDYAPEEYVLHDRDEIVLIPPVSGG